MLSSEAPLPRRRLFLAVTTPIPRWKRALDLCGCMLALPFLGIATAFVYVLLALTSGGSVFYRQERIGYLGRKFTLYKFRTMHANADCASHRAHFSDLVNGKKPMQKLDAARDSRLVAGGWLLRASGIDELPQIINVLRGEMSLVGPRPCIPYEYEQYSSWQRARFTAVPGLTGLWQVSGKNRTTFDEMVRLDIRYSEIQSLWVDLKIVALTIPALCVQISDTHIVRKSSVRSGVVTPAPRSTTATLQT